MLAIVGESAPSTEGSRRAETVLPRCETLCLGIDLFGVVAVDGNGREERELEVAP